MRIVRFKITAIVLALVMTMTCGSALAWADAGGGINGGVGAGGSLLDQMKMVPLYDRAGKQYEIRFCYIDKPYKQFGNYDEEVAYLQGVDKKPVDVKVITNAFPGCSSGELCSTLRIDGGKNYKKGNLIVGEIVCPEDRENVPVYFTMTDSTGKTHAFDGKTSNSAYLTTWFYLSDNCDLTISVGHKHEVKTDGSNQSSGSEQTTQPASTTGKWVKSGSLWWYRYSDGSYPKSCAKTIDGATYRFDSAVDEDRLDSGGQHLVFPPWLGRNGERMAQGRCLVLPRPVFRCDADRQEYDWRSDLLPDRIWCHEDRLEQGGKHLVLLPWLGCDGEGLA